MKLMHLSDLHIGKRIYERSMLADQKYILGRILALAKEEQVDAVLVAGDLYDKPVPPAEAVQVLDDFLTGLADCRIPVCAISGNHDSAQRLAFGTRLMKERGVYLSPTYGGELCPVDFQDPWGTVHVYLLPFLKPATVRWALEDEGIVTCEDGVRAVLGKLSLNPAERNVLIAHQFVTGAARCESEDVFVGGLDQVDGALFEAFDYVALGHLHSPQKVGRKTLRYCGSPLKYSFSEAGQEKSVTIVELAQKGQVNISAVPLKPLHDVRKIRGTYLQVTAWDFYAGYDREDYLQVTLTDEEDIPDGMQKLRVIYPNLLSLEYDNRRTREDRMDLQACDTKQKSELELFVEFYEMQNNQPLSAVQEDFVRELIVRLKGEE